MIINMVGGSATTYAFIVVTYPSGSVCTCTDGSITLTATDTSGSFVFPIPSAGTWTVSCTNGTDTDSKTVTISSKGQSVSVDLSYIYYIIKDGNMQNGISYASSQVNISVSGGAINIDTNGQHHCNFYTSPIDMSSYSYCNIDYSSSVGSWGYFSIGNNTNWTDGNASGQISSYKYRLASSGSVPRQTVNLALNGAGTTRFKMHDYAACVAIYNVYLSKD